MSFLPDAESFRRLTNGTDRGLSAGLARALLTALSRPYGLGVGLRTLAYDRGWLRAAPAPVPVVSVGNLTLGGTGKSPLVGWVATTLSDAGLRPAILSRGYGARGDTCQARSEASDEGREFALTHPTIPHLAHPLRLLAAREAAANHAARVVVLDDGFQHRRIARALDIVAVDATDPLGGGRLFPRGLLREPVTALRRADCVVLTRCDRVAAEEPARIREAIETACGGLSGITWAESSHAPAGLRASDGTSLPMSALEGRRVLAVCGIGNPQPFRLGLEDLGASIADHLEFADHHSYGPGDIATILARAARSRAELIVTTLKDLVKIVPSRTAAGSSRISERFSAVPLVALGVRLKILRGEGPLRERILSACIAAGETMAATSSSRRAACVSEAAENTS